MVQYRNERKYFLNSHTAAILKGRAASVMQRDAHSGGLYTVNNLYLDDYCDSAYAAKYRGCYHREKFRVRYYNGDLSFIRLECKVKDGLLSYKESCKLTAEQYGMIRSGDFSFASGSGPPLLEKLATRHRLKGMRPTAEYSYIREAYVYRPGNVRITFDSNIGHDVPGLTNDMCNSPGTGGMLEVKYDNFLPEVIVMLLSGLPLVWTEMSKYCYVYEHERRVRPNVRQTVGSDYRFAASR